MKINAIDLYQPLAKINKILPHLTSLNRDSDVVIDISYGKMRVADSVQFWQVKADKLPDMLMVKGMARYLEKTLADVDEVIELNITDAHYELQFGPTVIKVARPTYLAYNNIEEVFLKPTLVNDIDLSMNTEEFRHGIEKIFDGVKPVAIGMDLTSSNVKLYGRDWFDNSVEYNIPCEFSGKDLVVAFGAPQIKTLASLIQDEVCNFSFGSGTKSRPAALLAKDEASGLLAVLPPINLK